MLMRDNILLTHISEPWLSEAAMLGASLVSKTVGFISIIPDLTINQNLAHGMTHNVKLLESKRADKARQLGWDLFFPDHLLDAIRTGKVGYSLKDIIFNSWAFQVCNTRSLFADLVSWAGSESMISADHRGAGGVSRQLHNILQREVYRPLKIHMPGYDQRTVYWQYIDLLFTVAFTQYTNWANGLSNSYNNLLGCYLLINGYKSDYVIRVDRWRSVDEKAIAAGPAKQQGSRIVSISSENATRNFKWSELMHSNYATANRINNVATGKERENLLELAQLLQVIRDWHGQSMSINSGFRSQKVNDGVGGVSDSAHRHGYAADIVFAGVPSGASNQLAFARKIAQFLKSKGIKFDQLISYNDFIHVGVRKPSGAQRCEVFHTNRYQSTIRYFK